MNEILYNEILMLCNISIDYQKCMEIFPNITLDTHIMSNPKIKGSLPFKVVLETEKRIKKYKHTWIGVDLKEDANILSKLRELISKKENITECSLDFENFEILVIFIIEMQKYLGYIVSDGEYIMQDIYKKMFELLNPKKITGEEYKTDRYSDAGIKQEVFELLDEFDLSVNPFMDKGTELDLKKLRLIPKKDGLLIEIPGFEKAKLEFHRGENSVSFLAPMTFYGAPTVRHILADGDESVLIIDNSLVSYSFDLRDYTCYKYKDKHRTKIKPMTENDFKFLTNYLSVATSYIKEMTNDSKKLVKR